MNAASFYRWSLLLPILLPVIAFSLAAQGLVPESLRTPAVWLMGSGFIGGLPYLLVLVFTRSRIRSLDRTRMERFLWRLPMLTAPLVALGALVLVILGPRRVSDVFQWREASALRRFATTLAFMTLAFGYGYVVFIRGSVGFVLWLRGGRTAA
jgi:hypothetical protein